MIQKSALIYIMGFKKKCVEKLNWKLKFATVMREKIDSFPFLYSQEKRNEAFPIQFQRPVRNMILNITNRKLLNKY